MIDLAQWMFEDYGITVTKQIISCELRALGYRKLSARPRHHEKNEAALRLLRLDFRPKDAEAGFDVVVSMPLALHL